MTRQRWHIQFSDIASRGVNHAKFARRGCRKPEEAPSIELERLWSHWTSLHGAEWEDVKRLPRRVKAPDVVRALLDEPGVALCVYRSGHNAVLRLGRFPGRDHASA